MIHITKFFNKQIIWSQGPSKSVLSKISFFHKQEEFIESENNVLGNTKLLLLIHCDGSGEIGAMLLKGTDLQLEDE